MIYIVVGFVISFAADLLIWNFLLFVFKNIACLTVTEAIYLPLTMHRM